MPKTEQQFEPIHDQFNILRKYEVQVSEEAELKLSKLQPSWMAFQQCLIDSEVMLEKHKVCVCVCVCVWWQLYLLIGCVHKTCHFV